MSEGILIVLGIVGIFVGLCILYSMPAQLLKRLKKSVEENIKKKEEKEEIYKALRNWLFG